MRLPIAVLLLVTGSLLLGRPGRSGAEALPPARGAEDVVTFLIVDETGKPVSSVLVFAAEAGSDLISKVGVSDDDGRGALVIPRRRHNFGLLTPAYGVQRLVARGPTSLVLVVRPMPPATLVPALAASAAWISGVHAFVVRGRVVDEMGVGLGGVRIDAIRGEGAVASTAITGAAGDFALAVPGGRYWLRTSAPGLKPVKWDRPGDGKRLTIVMAIAADVQRLEITDGKLLTFRLEDSVDPEYFPPPKVLAWMRYAYGICPSADPPTAHQRRNTKKYWWLDVLRTPPSSPAQRAVFNVDSCRPALTYLETAASWRNDNKSGGFGPLP